MGDDIPSDELNHAPRAGMHFGFPYCHRATRPTRATPGVPARNSRRPAVKLGPHVAALGMRFYTGTQFPAEIPQQYLHRRARLVEPQQQDRLSHQARDRERRQGGAPGGIRRRLVAGESAWGRPADIEVMTDGSLLASDDRAGAIYRISYRNKE